MKDDQFEDDLEREIWQHAACLSIAEGCPGWDKPTSCDSPAMVAVRELRVTVEAAKDVLRAMSNRPRTPCERDGHNFVLWKPDHPTDCSVWCTRCCERRDLADCPCGSGKAVWECCPGGREG